MSIFNFILKNIKKLFKFVMKNLKLLFILDMQEESAKKLFSLQMQDDITTFQDRIDYWIAYPDRTFFRLLLWVLLLLFFPMLFMWWWLMQIYGILCLYMFLIIDIIIIDFLFSGCPSCQLVYSYFRAVHF